MGSLTVYYKVRTEWLVDFWPPPHMRWTMVYTSMLSRLLIRRMV